MQLTETTNKNTQLAEEITRLRGQMGLAERAPKASGRGVRFCHLNKGLSSDPAGRDRAPTERHMRNGRSQQLEKKHEETKSALQRKEEEHTCLQKAQAEAHREHKETLQLIQVQVTEMYERNKELKCQHRQLFQELVRVEGERSKRVISRLC